MGEGFIANIIAEFIERAFGSKGNTVLTIAGILSACAAGLAAVPNNIVSPQYQPYVVGTAGLLGLIAGSLGHASKGPGSP